MAFSMLLSADVVRIHGIKNFKDNFWKLVFFLKGISHKKDHSIKTNFCYYRIRSYLRHVCS